MTTAPTQSARHRSDAPAPLTTEQVAALRSLLAGALTSHRADLEQLDAVASALMADTADGAARDLEMARLAADRARDAIADVEHALGRLDDGSYGTCESCARPLPFERLEAIPHARLCVSCPARSSGSFIAGGRPG